MGFKSSDVVPLASYGPTALTPAPKDVQAKVFQVLRTDTTAVVKAVLPADSTIFDIKIVGAASNAGTSATISVGSTVAATEFINAQDVKTQGGMIRPLASYNSATLPNLENIPLTGDITIYAKYAETGTVSSAGGPYTVIVEYVR